MTKKYIESFDYYKLLRELTNLPDGATSTPYYYRKKFQHIDVFVYFIRDCKNMSFLARFQWKYKNVPLQQVPREICQISCLEMDFVSYVFNDRVQTLSDFFDAEFIECREYTESMKLLAENWDFQM